MKEMLKLHLGCGTVYLDGYVNIDCGANPQARLACLRPDLVERWRTTRDQYYSKQQCLNLSGVNNSEFVADAFMDIAHLPFRPETVDEILVVQTFEHLTFREAVIALIYWRAILKEGGLLDMYVPDIEKSIQLFLDADTLETRRQVARLIFGTRKSPLFYHHFGYSAEGLRDLLRRAGFRSFMIADSDMHDYPALRVTARVHG